LDRRRPRASDRNPLADQGWMTRTDQSEGARDRTMKWRHRFTTSRRRRQCTAWPGAERVSQSHGGVLPRSLISLAIWVRGKQGAADQDMHIDYFDPTHNTDLTATAALIKARRSSARRLEMADSQSANLIGGWKLRSVIADRPTGDRSDRSG
jgi:hypothetical protein